MPVQNMISFPQVFSGTKGKTTPITLLTAKTLPAWLKKQSATIRARIENGTAFTAAPGTAEIMCDDKGAVTGVIAGISDPISLYDAAGVAESLARKLPARTVKSCIFALEDKTIPAATQDAFCLGWALAGYKFDLYKKDPGIRPILHWPQKADKKRIQAMAEAIGMLRTLINTPANDLGPAELEAAARRLATKHKATIKIVSDGALLTQNFPMIHAVGKGSTRRPRLIDLNWGKAAHPKLTLVGKGVCFDTGGLNIKPGAFMLTMKKDMGGAAHVLALAHIIISLNIPVRLRVLIPAVENSISGDAFRPWDVLQSRKGLTVEVGDTDAEGRLVLADALTLACEEKPDLLIDFATLTGSARIALGYDLPAVFCNNDKLADDLKTHGAAAEDPVWPLPLWQPYRKEMKSDVADISSTGNGKAGAIAAALFLESFVEAKQDWIHLDIFAWEQNGRAGRPRGGSDTGLRAVLALIEKRYGKG